VDKSQKKLKVAVVYDWVNKLGGAERVLSSIMEIWPEASLYSLFYDSKGARWAKGYRVVASFLNKIPFASTRHEFFALLAGFGFESFDFSRFDLVISVSSYGAKGILTGCDTVHVDYCLTPTRFLYSGEKDYLDNPGFGSGNFMAKIFMKMFGGYLRDWDRVASCRPDMYIAISENVKRRIRKYYSFDSELVYPGVDFERFDEIGRGGKVVDGDYYLVVSRLVWYKRVDLVIEAFNRCGKKIKIIGMGKELRKLKGMAKDNIEFLGELTDEEVIRYYQGCCGVIMAGEEDFGLTSVEAQYFGKGVVAYGLGGSAETVIDGVTGVLYFEKSADGILQGLKKFEKIEVIKKECKDNALKFSKERFKKMFKEVVLKKYKEVKEEL